MSVICEIQSVFHLLNARNIKLALIDFQICIVYGEHVMNVSMVYD